MYLMIENPGVAPYESFTMLGASITRNCGNSNTIGMFGTGAKQSITLLLRENINPVIFTDLFRIRIYSEPHEVKDSISSTTFNRVLAELSGKDPSTGKQVRRTEKLSWTLEHGVHDWTDINTALREFVSNAIDMDVRLNNTYNNVRITMVEDNQVRAKAGTTRIFIPSNFTVEKFYQELPKRFLQFSSKTELESVILPKRDRNLNNTVKSPVLFKKGVRVRELYSMNNSMFDYNLGEELKLDESRNLDDYQAKAYITQKLAKADEVIRERLIKAIISGQDFWETKEIDDYSFKNLLAANTLVKSNWAQTWNKLTNNAVITQGQPELDSFITAKGLSIQVVANPKWYGLLKYTGIKNETEILAQNELNGAETFASTPNTDEVLNKVWELFAVYNLTAGKIKPTAKLFKPIMNGGVQKNGEYKDNCVYIHTNISEDKGKLLFKIMLEEVAHHITGSTDKTRDLQDALFNLITEMSF